MTWEEKARLVVGLGYSWDFYSVRPGFYAGQVQDVPRLGVPASNSQDAAEGFRTNFQEFVGTVTSWPSGLSAATTWDTDLMLQYAAHIGAEFKAKGANQILGPSVDIARVQQGGRNSESIAGEDPNFAAIMTKQYVVGMQGEGVACVAKHFVMNTQETNRNSQNNIANKRDMWEIHYPPFIAANEVDIAGVMCSYNGVNGEKSCENNALLMGDLKEKMGFKGFVMSDWGATHSTSLRQGLDMDQPGSVDSFFNAQTLSLSADTSLLDSAVHRTLAATYRLRLHEYPGCVYPTGCTNDLHTDVTNAAHRVLARDVATSAVVLLKNNGILPLQAHRVRTIAIVGQAAAARPVRLGVEVPGNQGLPGGDYYSGGGSGHVHAASVVMPLDAITRRARDANIEVLASASDDLAAAERLALQADV
eukprot:CAMPEP_0177566436 /NCGR_PEP_ID=MMETSP0369-20130122/74675_1 /TAXON_ID=447022 ORGANISM="Scrippsiella hangoei-like, Strain SHHI-4" /NCGR_SAMPLE_ID=MMETSP0369 /ASSEMBLY_ACC=CAM_ASM_000364 /LENGTH=418 /DNA_ID=CAMNT_0019053845 /DNA_START=34 /DNA_END=1287 /DNA_ORIENTATION=-